MRNRVIEAIARMEEQVQCRINAGIVTAGQVEATRRKLDMDITEYVKFQELKSLASVNGKLTPEEAQTVYMYLGNTPSAFNANSAACKAVLTKIFAELLEANIGMGCKQYA
jgi:hypothetical protein